MPYEEVPVAKWPDVHESMEHGKLTTARCKLLKILRSMCEKNQGIMTVYPKFEEACHKCSDLYLLSGRLMDRVALRGDDYPPGINRNEVPALVRIYGVRELEDIVDETMSWMLQRGRSTAFTEKTIGEINHIARDLDVYIQRMNEVGTVINRLCETFHDVDFITAGNIVKVLHTNNPLKVRDFDIVRTLPWRQHFLSSYTHWLSRKESANTFGNRMKPQPHIQDNNIICLTTPWMRSNGARDYTTGLAYIHCKSPEATIVSSFHTEETVERDFTRFKVVRTSSEMSISIASTAGSIRPEHSISQRGLFLQSKSTELAATGQRWTKYRDSTGSEDNENISPRMQLKQNSNSTTLPLQPHQYSTNVEPSNPLCHLYNGQDIMDPMEICTQSLEAVNLLHSGMDEKDIVSRTTYPPLATSTLSGHATPDEILPTQVGAWEACVNGPGNYAGSLASTAVVGCSRQLEVGIRNSPILAQQTISNRQRGEELKGTGTCWPTGEAIGSFKSTATRWPTGEAMGSLENAETCWPTGEAIDGLKSTKTCRPTGEAMGSLKNTETCWPTGEAIDSLKGTKTRWPTEEAIDSLKSIETRWPTGEAIDSLKNEYSTAPAGLPQPSLNDEENYLPYIETTVQPGSYARDVSSSEGPAPGRIGSEPFVSTRNYTETLSPPDQEHERQHTNTTTTMLTTMRPNPDMRNESQDGHGIAHTVFTGMETPSSWNSWQETDEEERNERATNICAPPLTTVAVPFGLPVPNLHMDNKLYEEIDQGEPQRGHMIVNAADNLEILWREDPNTNHTVSLIAEARAHAGSHQHRYDDTNLNTGTSPTSGAHIENALLDNSLTDFKELDTTAGSRVQTTFLPDIAGVPEHSPRKSMRTTVPINRYVPDNSKPSKASASTLRQAKSHTNMPHAGATRGGDISDISGNFCSLPTTKSGRHVIPVDRYKPDIQKSNKSYQRPTNMISGHASEESAKLNPVPKGPTNEFLPRAKTAITVEKAEHLPPLLHAPTHHLTRPKSLGNLDTAAKPTTHAPLLLGSVGIDTTHKRSLRILKKGAAVMMDTHQQKYSTTLAVADAPSTRAPTKQDTAPHKRQPRQAQQSSHSMVTRGSTQNDRNIPVMSDMQGQSGSQMPINIMNEAGGQDQTTGSTAMKPHKRKADLHTASSDYEDGNKNLKRKRPLRS